MRIHDSAVAISYVVMILIWSRFGTQIGARVGQFAQARGYGPSAMAPLIRDLLIGIALALFMAVFTAWPIYLWFSQS